MLMLFVEAPLLLCPHVVTSQCSLCCSVEDQASTRQTVTGQNPSVSLSMGLQSSSATLSPLTFSVSVPLFQNAWGAEY